MEYRRDIDGLRAVAVILILIFHVNPSRLPGGFVGVDVFFVISGYLISSILIRDINASVFSFWDFYARRVRRLFPALFVLLICTAAVGFFVLLPSELQSMSYGLVATLVYASNFFFLSKSGYFDSDTENHPLLHTWSLSVEEQFYFILPVALVIVLRLAPKQLRFWITVGVVASFALCQWLQSFDASAAFYVSPARFWEFGVGAVLATFSVRPSNVVRQISGAFGLLLVLWSAWSFSSATQFPGYMALIPSLGAALIIVSGTGGESAISRLLSVAPLRWIGAISYSLYLWHWPIIVYYRISTGEDISRLEELLLLVLCVFAGAISYYAVERPTRNLPIRGRSKQVIAWGTGVGLAGVLFSIFVIATGGLANRFPSEVSQYASYLDYDPNVSNRVGTCFITSASDAGSFDDDSCLNRANDAERVLLIGDSHAAHLVPGLVELLDSVALSQVTASGCKPVLHPVGHVRCTSLMQRAFDEIIPESGFDEVIIAGRWTREDVAAVADTARYVAQFSPKVTVIGPVPTYGLPLPRLLALAAMQGSQQVLLASSRLSEARQIDDLMRQIIPNGSVGYVSLVEAMCTGDVCLTEVGGRPVQYDYGHLTAEGSEVVLRSVASELQVPR